MQETTSQQQLPLPTALHHAAYVTHDVAATVDFYTRVLNMKLCSTVLDDQVPSTGDPFPYIHLFFEMGDGSTIAFFESLDLPAPAEVSHPAYKVFEHFAMEAGSKDAVDKWCSHLKANGIDVVGPVEHGIIYSIYFYDPNGIRLELTTTLDETWKDHESQAAQDIEDWLKLKEQARAEGSSASAVKWIKERRGAYREAR